MVEIDGNYLEGGGQIIRSSIALSVITGKSVHIHSIRRGRKNPGLRPQHLEAVAGLAKVCGASVDGLKIQSQNTTFCPGPVQGGSYTIDTRTAGSATLVMQTLLPITAYIDASFNWLVKGGTAVPFSPSIIYFRDVFCFLLRLLGIQVSVHINKHGFYPAGGGEIAVSTAPSVIKTIDLIERDELEKIEMFSLASIHLKEKHVAERMTDGFRGIFPESVCETSYVNSKSPGCFVTAFATYKNGCRIGCCTLGEIRKRAEDVGRDAARHLKGSQDSAGVIDYWMVDQIIPYLAISAIKNRKPSRIKIPCLTKHAETNIWVVKKFLPVDFKIKDSILACSQTG